MTTEAQAEPMVRPSAVAGAWYPGTARALREELAGYLARVDLEPLGGTLLGLVAPHAGYAYSGQTAAYAYKQLQGMAVERVVICSPNHRALWRADLVTTQATHYETPLGLVEVDRAFVDRLASRVTLQSVLRDSEHSLEIQLPFLQFVLGTFLLVPIMINTDRPEVAHRLGTALAELVKRAEGWTLLVASTDLHHIPDYTEVVRRDRLVTEALLSYDMDRIEGVLTAPDCSVCGRMAVMAVLHAASQLGADRVRVLHQTNSGEVTGIRTPGQYTVGYLAAAVVASAQ